MSFGRITPEISKNLAQERLQVLIERAALKERGSPEKLKEREHPVSPKTKKITVNDKLVDRKPNRNSLLQRDIRKPWKRQTDSERLEALQPKKLKREYLSSEDDEKEVIERDDDDNDELGKFYVKSAESSSSLGNDQKAENLKKSGSETTEEEIATEENIATNQTKKLDEDLFKPLGAISRSKKESTLVGTLPQWIKRAVTVPAKVEANADLEEDADLFGNSLIRILRQNGINGFFPMQRQVMRELLDAQGLLQEFPARDLCVAAPTGSGKTLAYVAPLVKLLEGKFERLIRAVILLPTSELAKQVYDVFMQYAASSNLSAGLLTGLKSHTDEIKSILERGHSLVDVIIATPAKLLEHLRTTPEFSLSHVNYLVLDEADRMLDMILHGLITEVERAIYSRTTSGCQCEKIHDLGRCRLANISCCIVDAHKLPLRKLLYSATLMADPEKLQCLNLFYPRVFHAKADVKSNNSRFVKKFALPSSLKEVKVHCRINIRPLLVWWLSVHNSMGRMIVFTRTREECYRLCTVIKEMGSCRVADLSSNLKKRQRQNTLLDFDNGLFDVLVCTSVLARGMDLKNVQHVVLYHMPNSAEEYVHMVGRTARANKVGTSIVLLDKAEDSKLSKILIPISNCKPKCLDFNEDSLNEFHEQFEKALASAKKSVLNVSEIET